MLTKIIKRLRALPNSKKGIWVNNLTLRKSFEAGDTVNISYDFSNKIVIVEKAEILGNHTISFRKSDEKRTPILDIKNQSIDNLFKDVEKVEIQFYKDRLVIKVAAIEELKNERINKTGLKTFELFCGGGTLSQMFKQAGFNPVGGLDIEEKYLEVFEDNHKPRYTILSSLEDVAPNDYPKDVDVLLAGIPCDKFSPSNKGMIEAFARYKNGIASQKDLELIEERNQAEYLTFYVLEAIRAMNVKTVVIEEVVPYSVTNASHLLRGILKHMGYELSETISSGTNTKRKRWCLVANMTEKINLNNLLPDSSKTINDCLEIPIDKREWFKKEEMPRIARAANSVGIRAMLPSMKKANSFTTHSTRSCEPILKHPQFNLFSEFTNQEIANIHGLVDYKLSGTKTTDRQILGQGVSDMFYFIAHRIKDALGINTLSTSVAC